MTRQRGRESLERWGMAVVCRTLDEAIEWVNLSPPNTSNCWCAIRGRSWKKVRHAGAVFLGPWSTVPLGDYIAGPNHVLPTNGTARFTSPLGVYDFVLVDLERRRDEPPAGPGHRTWGRPCETEGASRPRRRHRQEAPRRRRHAVDGTAGWEWMRVKEHAYYYLGTSDPRAPDPPHPQPRR